MKTLLCCRCCFKVLSPAFSLSERRFSFLKNKFEKRGDCYAIFANRKGTQHEILIDEADFKEVAAFPGTWRVCKNGNTFYARTHICDSNGKRKTVQMHRAILNPPADLQVDHKNHNGLDNRRENTRIATC